MVSVVAGVCRGGGFDTDNDYDNDIDPDTESYVGSDYSAKTMGQGPGESGGKAASLDSYSLTMWPSGWSYIGASGIGQEGRHHG